MATHAVVETTDAGLALIAATPVPVIGLFYPYY